MRIRIIMRFVLLFCFVVLSSYLRAQKPTQSVQGKVVDESSMAPVAFATVVLFDADTTWGIATDTSGSFLLKNIPIGRYSLKASFIGYEPVLIKELTVSSAKAPFVEVKMKESSVALQAVIVKPKVNKQEPLNQMATVSARMLSVEEAERYAGGFDDPARLASSFAGVASNVANNGIVIRGNAPRSLQWKMEGIEIPNPNHFADLSAFGGGGITALSSNMLANSDFFTGAFPAEYNNALSGVFDMKVRSGNNSDFEHTIEAGAIGVDLASEGPFSSKGNSSYLFNYRYSTLGLVEPLLPPEAQGTNYQDLSFKLKFPTKKAGVFSLWGIGLIDNSGKPAERDSSDWKYQLDLEHQDAQQYMGAIGLAHSYLINDNTYIKSTLAATISGLEYESALLNDQLILEPKSRIENFNRNFIFNSAINKKFSAGHNNKTGITITAMGYNLLLKETQVPGQQPDVLVDKRGMSSLISAYSSSSIDFAPQWNLTLGINSQLFTLNNNYTIEPRAGITYEIDNRQSVALAYGLHSRLEKLHYYFTGSTTGEEINKDIGFSKAHHFVASYERSLSENLHFKVEPYFQYLYNIPVIADSSFSFINLHGEWFINHKLINEGEGKNYGIDLTLEKYLSRGYYFMLTGSVFNSTYSGGDGIWRDTRYNRNFLFNFLTGKEWYVGRDDKNVFGLNVRFSLQGGDRYSPVLTEISLMNEEVVYNEDRAFSKKTDPSFVAHLTAEYKINREKVLHEVALKILNATMQNEFYGYRYNFVHHSIDAYREALMIPNLSYKLSF